MQRKEGKAGSLRLLVVLVDGETSDLLEAEVVFFLRHLRDAARQSPAVSHGRLLMRTGRRDCEDYEHKTVDRIASMQLAMAGRQQTPSREPAARAHPPGPGRSRRYRPPNRSAKSLLELCVDGRRRAVRRKKETVWVHMCVRWVGRNNLGAKKKNRFWQTLSKSRMHQLHERHTHTAFNIVKTSEGDLYAKIYLRLECAVGRFYTNLDKK